MSTDQVTGQVHSMFHSLVAELGGTFSREQLLAEVAYLRVKPLRIQRADFPPGITGGCLALSDLDLIVVRAGLEPLRLLFSELHECGHLLFGHVPVSDMTYAEFLQTSAVEGVVYRDFVTAYDRPREASVELLATLLIERILSHEEQKRANASLIHMFDLYG